MAAVPIALSDVAVQGSIKSAVVAGPKFASVTACAARGARNASAAAVNRLNVMTPLPLYAADIIAEHTQLPQNPLRFRKPSDIECGCLGLVVPKLCSTSQAARTPHFTLNILAPAFYNSNAQFLTSGGSQALEGSPVIRLGWASQLFDLPIRVSGAASLETERFTSAPGAAIDYIRTSARAQYINPQNDQDYSPFLSSLVLIVVCAVVTERVVEPRLGKYRGEIPTESGEGVSPEEARGLRLALYALVASVVAIVLLTFPSGAPLRDPDTGAIVGNSPFMSSLIVQTMLVFLAIGAAYGIGAKTITSMVDGINAVTKTFASLSPLIFLLFVISQVLAYFTYSNIATIIAVNMGDALEHANLGTIPLMLGFITVTGLVGLLIVGVIPKWALLAPIFVPLFMKLGVAPEAVLAAYRVGDSPPNVVSPLMPYFALIVVFAQRYDKEAGVGTVVAMMLSYGVAVSVVWIVLFLAWELLGLPYGPG
jgi:aminobenzoyl-glutamate transport protein